MTVEEMILKLCTYPKDLPIIMHLGNGTPESADTSVRVMGVVPYCQLREELVSALSDRGNPQKKCSRCLEVDHGNCKIGKGRIGENMIDVLEVAGDW